MEDPTATTPPDLTWLDTVEADLADVEHVLACLDRDDPEPCPDCIRAEADGSLEGRPPLALCAAERVRSGPASADARPIDQD